MRAGGVLGVSRKVDRVRTDEEFEAHRAAFRAGPRYRFRRGPARLGLASDQERLEAVGHGWKRHREERRRNKKRCVENQALLIGN